MNQDTKIALLEQSIGHINETMLRIEKRFDAIDRRFDAVDKKFDGVDKRFNLLEQDMKQGFKDINNRLWSNFFWMIGGFIGILGLIARTQHWI